MHDALRATRRETHAPDGASVNPSTDRSLRTLLVTQQLRGTRSGVGRYARILVEEMVARDQPPLIATWTSEIDDQAFPTCSWLPLGERPSWDPTPGGFLALGRRLRQELLSAEQANEHALDSVDALFFTDAREAAWLLRGDRPLPAARLVGTIHDDYAARAPRRVFGLVGRARDPLRRWAYYRWLARLERRVYPQFDLLMANARITADTVARAYGLASAAIPVVSLCSAPAQDRAFAEASLAGAPSLLFAGGNFYRKGLDVLIRALPAVREQFDGVHVHVAGRDAGQGKLERLARRCDVQRNVTFHGRVERERMAHLMHAADQFVMPSRTEALGLVYLEAMLAGTPVISGDRGGVVEIVRHEQTGLNVPIEDSDALAAAICRLATDTELATRLVAQGRAEAAQRTPLRLVDETFAALRTV